MKKIFIRSFGILTGASMVLMPAVLVAQTEGSATDAATETTTGTGVAEPTPTNPKPPPLKTTRPKPGTTVREKINTVQDRVQDARANASSTKPGLPRPAVIKRIEPLRKLASTTKEGVRAHLTENRETLRLRKEEIRDKAKERFGEAAQRSINNIIEKLNSAVDRMEEVATKVDAKITELEGQGLAMTQSTTLLQTARTNIADAQLKIDAVSTALEGAIDSTTPKDKVAAIRAAVKAAEAALRLAKKALNETIASVRAEAGASTEPPATDTATQ